MKPRSRKGFALLTVMWVLVVVGGTAARSSVDVGVDLLAARNRTHQMRAFWIAKGCQATILASVVRDYRARSHPDARERFWNRDVAAGREYIVPACEITWQPSGRALPVALMSSAEVERLLSSAGYALHAQRMATALEDWQDADGTVVGGGSEDSWYAANGRPAPRNGPFESDKEIALVRGWERGGVAALGIAAASDRLSLSHASPAVMEILPGFTDEVVAFVTARRVTNEGLRSLAELLDGVSEGARRGLQRGFDELNARVVVGTEAWTLRTTGTADRRSVTLAARIERRASGFAIVREWVE